MLQCILSETSLQLITSDAVVSGETAIMASQSQEFPKNQKLKIKMQRLKNSEQNGISVLLEGTYGFSRIPVIRQGINIATEKTGDTIDLTDMKCSSDADEMECSYCVPGGQNVTHRVILAGVYQTDDEFYIHDIEFGEEDCIFPRENITSGKPLLSVTLFIISVVITITKLFWSVQISFCLFLCHVLWNLLLFIIL